MEDRVVYAKGYDLEDLQNTVRMYIAKGYIPYGPVVPFKFGTPGTCGYDRGFVQTLIEANIDVATALFK